MIDHVQSSATGRTKNRQVGGNVNCAMTTVVDDLDSNSLFAVRIF